MASLRENSLACARTCFACARKLLRSCNHPVDLACARCMLACARSVRHQASVRETVPSLRAFLREKCFACANREKTIKAQLELLTRVRILKIGSLVLRIFYLQGPDLRRLEEKIDDDE
ncbi:hypothetical protein P8452_42310 [Trifolium repens]|nr:hypothetical protein P8452_42310 [Trifolium repens]